MTDERDLRPDHELEGRVNSWLTETDLSPDEANAGLGRLLDEFPVTPQTRRRLLGRWLERDGGAGRRTTEHDHPPNTNRRNRNMLSATGIAAAIVIIAVASNVFEADPTVPGQAGTTHVVAADGSGDFSTIQEAVTAAAEGDTISVEPGRYQGTVTVDRDLVISGDGQREQIVIVAPPGEVDATTWPEEDARPHALLLVGADVTVTDITVEVPLGSTGIGAMGGDPLLERVSIVNAGPPVPEDEWYDSYYAMWFGGVGEPTVRESDWNGYTAVRDGAAATFEGNTIATDGISIDGPGASTVRDNVFIEGGSVNSSGATVMVEGNDFTGGNFSADSRSTVEVRGNTFRDFEDSGYGDAAIFVFEVGSRATIDNNTVSNADNGIFLADGATGSIQGNSIEASRIGVKLGSGGETTVEGNTIEGEGAGILISRGSEAMVTGNTVDVAGRAIAIANGSSPTVSGNVVCGMEGIWVADEASPQLGENQVC